MEVWQKSLKGPSYKKRVIVTSFNFQTMFTEMEIEIENEIQILFLHQVNSLIKYL